MTVKTPEGLTHCPRCDASEIHRGWIFGAVSRLVRWRQPPYREWTCARCHMTLYCTLVGKPAVRSEQNTTCELCGETGLTVRGLTRHQKGRDCRELRAEHQAKARGLMPATFNVATYAPGVGEMIACRRQEQKGTGERYRPVVWGRRARRSREHVKTVNVMKEVLFVPVYVEFMFRAASQTLFLLSRYGDTAFVRAALKLTVEDADWRVRVLAVAKLNGDVALALAGDERLRALADVIEPQRSSRFAEAV